MGDGEPAEFDVGERKQERERENRRFARRWQNRADARGEAPIHYGVALLATHLPLPLQ